jgi:HAD superfamily hydrolase (TIGR01490 family)
VKLAKQTPAEKEVHPMSSRASDDEQAVSGNASAERALEDLAAGHISDVARDATLDPDGRSAAAAGDGTPESPPADLTAAAFFDVDNTLVQGSSLVHFGRGLAARKYFTYGDLGRFIWAQAKFQLTGRENSEDVAAGRRKALAFIEGRSTAELVALGEEIFDEIIADKIWPGTRALAQMHLDAGQQVWLVTATPYELAETIATRLGLTGALGTVAESIDGVFTGRLVGEILHGTGKAHAVRALAIREGLNLKRCTAYSDSYNDVPMLSLVGTPVAINPDADLRDVARERDWEIRDFRTARKAARIGVPSALALGAAGGALAAAVSRRHERG